MKKILSGIIGLALVLSIVTASAYDIGDNTVGLIINEEWVSTEQPPVLENDRTLAPVRIIAESLEFNVGWDEYSQKVTLTRDDAEIVMYIGNTTIIKNGETIQSDVAPMILNEKTMVPVRIISELMGCDVEWNEDSYTVFVDSPKAFNYYENLDYTNRFYTGGETTVSGYLGMYEVKFDPILGGIPRNKYYITLDVKANVMYDDEWGNPVTAQNIKTVEVNGDFDTGLVGKKVVAYGEFRGVSSTVNHGPVVFFADRMEEDMLAFGKADAKGAFMQLLDSKNRYTGEAVKYAKLIDINNDGADELIILDRADTMNYADVCIYSFGDNGIDEEKIEIGSYSQSGNFKDGDLDIYVGNGYITVRNDISNVESPDPDDIERVVRYTKYSIADNGEILEENGSANGSFTNMLEIVGNFSYGTAYMEVNEGFFDTREEVEEQLNR